MTNNNENKILYKELSYKLQGLFYDIRNDLGSGHKESIYQKALEKELQAAGIAFQKEPAIKIYSAKKEYLGLYRPDFLIENKIIIEIKAAHFVTKQENARVYDYLRNSKYELAYLVNFASPKLYLKRLIFTNDRKKWLNNPRTINDPQIITNKKRIPTKIAIKLLLFIAITGIMAFRGVSGAELSPESLTQEAGLNQQFRVDLILDAEGESINAVSGKIAYQGDFVELKEISDGSSIISFWIDNPKMPTNQKINGNEFIFSGIIPGGYQETRGLVLSMLFLAKKVGNAEISIKETKILLNDGKGTETKSSSRDLFVAIRSDIREDSWISPKDTEPPETFKPEIAQDPNMFDGKWFLVFATQDKGAGIDYYEIKETRQKFFGIFAKWVTAESPYVLTDQELRSYVWIRAVDKAGNKRIISLPPKYPLKWYEMYEIWSIIILGIIITAFVVRKIWQRKKIIHE